MFELTIRTMVNVRTILLDVVHLQTLQSQAIKIFNEKHIKILNENVFDFIVQLRAD